MVRHTRNIKSHIAGSVGPVIYIKDYRISSGLEILDLYDLRAGCSLMIQFVNIHRRMTDRCIAAKSLIY